MKLDQLGHIKVNAGLVFFMKAEILL